MDYTIDLYLQAEGKIYKITKHHLKGCAARLYSLNGAGLCNAPTIRTRIPVESYALNSFTEKGGERDEVYTVGGPTKRTCASL